MNNNELFFSYSDTVTSNEQDVLVKIGVELTRDYINKTNDGLFEKYSIDEALVTNNVKEDFRKKLFKYAFDKCNATNVNLDSPEDIINNLNIYDSANKIVFSIISKIATAINANNEVEQALMFAQVVSVGIGDSYTKEIESKALYKVQEHSYGNNVTRFQKQLRQPITISPKLKVAGIKFNIIQMAKVGYDWGREIAKLAKSFRAKMYQDIIDTVYTVANVSSTPFYLATFAKATFTAMIDQLDATNGGAGVTVYGTRTALMNQSNGITNGYMTQDEINKKAFITNLYGVQTSMINQAVNSNTASYTVRVPNNYLIALSNIAEKPTVLVRGGGMRVLEKNGTESGYYEKTYIVMEDWNVKLMTSANYGMIKVAA